MYGVILLTPTKYYKQNDVVWLRVIGGNISTKQKKSLLEDAQHMDSAGMVRDRGGGRGGGGNFFYNKKKTALKKKLL